MIRADLLHHLPDRIAIAIKELIPDLRTCESFEGRVTNGELKQLAAKAPGVLVTRTGLRQASSASGDQQELHCRMSAIVVTKNALGEPRDRAAQVISQVLCALIPENDWGLREEGVGRARTLSEEGFITEDTRKQGVSIWGLAWIQPVVLQAAAEIVPVELQTLISHVPEIGAAHEDDYVDIAEGGP